MSMPLSGATSAAELFFPVKKPVAEGNCREHPLVGHGLKK